MRSESRALGLGGGLLMALALGACTENNFYTQKHTDVFQQARRNTVDVLLVVDNSCSMVEEQNKLASNFQAFIQFFQGVDVDYQIGVITTDNEAEEFSGRLVGGDDEVILRSADGLVLERVAWDRDWDLPAGASWSLDPTMMTVTGNDRRDAWCSGVSAYGAGDLGSPGAENPSCGASGPEADDTGGDTASGDSGAEESGEGTAPVVGDLIISELMVDPAAVADELGEWVELTNVSDHTLDLSGLTVADDGRNGATIPAGTTLAAGERIVLSRSADDAANGGLTASVALADGMTLNNDVLILKPDTEGAGEIFSEMVAQGTTGTGIEMGLDAALSALSEPLLSTTNVGFLRPEANLSLIIVSDENDSSQYAVDHYYTYFAGLKGDAAFRDHSLFNLSAVVGSEEPQFEGDPSCSSDDGVASFGSRYVDLAQRTNGLIESICDDDFSPIAQELGLTLSGLVAEYELSERPREDTLEVSLYSSASEEDFEKELVRDVDYVYVVERNSLRFEEGQVPPSQWFIKVEYELLPNGAVQESDTGEDGTP
ncbi:lamin tail domain-containing protein [Myxococcota bacterium]|nr:lamin tail domain-containing protein [Myxococcota bacterium]